jgi:hypothetical protein
MNRVIIAGSRDITNYSLVLDAIRDSGFVINEVVSGGARGPDSLGEKYASENDIPIKKFPADWSLGKSAGYIRNKQMAEYGTHLIAVTNGSRGTAHMIDLAKSNGLIIYVKNVNK